MEKFVEILKTNPDHAFDWIANEGYSLSKTELVMICKELVYALSFAKDNCNLDKYDMESIYQCITENLESWI